MFVHWGVALLANTRHVLDPMVEAAGSDLNQGLHCLQGAVARLSLSQCLTLKNHPSSVLFRENIGTGVHLKSQAN